MSPKIDYALLGEVLGKYQQRGYQYVEVPWIVPKQVIRATLPAPAPFIEAVLHQDDDDDMPHASYSSIGGLVGSAEQALIGMNLTPGSYCAITPCFRHEATTGLFHQTGFMKLELFDNTAGCDYSTLLSDAHAILSKFTDHKISIVENVNSVDLELAGIEIGSYGNRHHGDYGPWAYGTGLALPRFSVAKAVAGIL